MGTFGRPVPPVHSPSSQELAAYLPLAHRAVRRFSYRLPPNVLRDDLLADATAGLLDALRRSPDRGPTFAHYARVRIEGSIVDGLRSQDWLCRSVRRRVRLGTEPCTAVVSLDELAERVGLDPTDTPRRTPEEELDHKRQCGAIGRAVMRLPEREASIVTSHYFEGVELQEIAARLCVSGARVSQLHHRALTLMRATLDEPPSRGVAA
jgi:RNA polymerase sigma factor for flagellar operon FliA